MNLLEMEQLLRNIDQRVIHIEQILPTLATKEDVRSTVADAIAPLATKAQLAAAIAEAIAPLATKAELAAAIAEAIAPLATKAELAAVISPLATKAELREALQEEGERTRNYMLVLTEDLRGDIRLLAEAHVALERRVTKVEENRS